VEKEGEEELSRSQVSGFLCVGKVQNTPNFTMNNGLFDMKPIGFGLIILLVAFVLAAYALFVPWSIVQRAQASGHIDLNALSDFFNSLYNALQIGLLALILGIIGTLVFLVEFNRHEHTTHLAPRAPTFSSNPELPVPSTQPSPRFCKFCGEVLVQGESVCRKCGTVVSS
jgi:hypothetical protein